MLPKKTNNDFSDIRDPENPKKLMRGVMNRHPLENLCFQGSRPSSLLKTYVKTPENARNGVFFIPSINLPSRINFNHHIREETILHHSPRRATYISKA